MTNSFIVKPFATRRNSWDSVLVAILVHASWNTFYSAALVQLFPAPGVPGSYSNLAICREALALVIVAVTRDRLGYRQEEAEEEPEPATVPAGGRVSENN